jgi:hypothetical protein
MRSHFYLLDMMALRLSPPLFFGLHQVTGELRAQEEPLGRPVVVVQLTESARV